MKLFSLFLEKRTILVLRLISILYMQHLTIWKPKPKKAKKEKIKLYPISAYRTFEYQKKLYENSKKKNGLIHAEKYSARPGRSQHHLATAVDFNDVEVRFGNTREYQWLQKNAGKYGFSMSYPEGQEDITGYAYEPWHFRYIGTDAVELQDTFFNGSQQKMLEFLNENIFKE